MTHVGIHYTLKYVSIRLVGKREQIELLVQNFRLIGLMYTTEWSFLPMVLPKLLHIQRICAFTCGLFDKKNNEEE